MTLKRLPALALVVALSGCRFPLDLCFLAPDSVECNGGEGSSVGGSDDGGSDDGGDPEPFGCRSNLDCSEKAASVCDVDTGSCGACAVKDDCSHLDSEFARYGCKLDEPEGPACRQITECWPGEGDWRCGGAGGEPEPISIPEPVSYFPFDVGTDDDLRGEWDHVPGVAGDAVWFGDRATTATSVRIPDGPAADSDSFSLSYWVYTTDQGPVGWSFSIVHMENLGLEVSHYDTGHSHMMYDGRYGGGSSHAETNRWYHIAVTSDGSDTLLFIDGVRVQRQPGEGRRAAGIRVNPGTAFLDELRIYDRVITEGEIRQLSAYARPR